ncbi:hypothetical protein AB4076_10970 [Dyella sp. 2RAF44]|uniref:hypothetical protein n=1 Tax=Dyella sp. 2RAF44 TaxID=3233000 RepID=UPI003F93C188
MERHGQKPLFPATVSAGLKFSVVVSTPSAPSPSWVATAYLRGPASINIRAAAFGDGQHRFDATPAESSEWKAGKYWYAIRVASGDDEQEVERGEIEVLPDFASLPEGYDGRSENEKALDSIRAVLSKRATQDQQRYVIDNRELWRTPIPELLQLRAHYEALVRRERRRKNGGGAFGRNIPVVFS